MIEETPVPEVKYVFVSTDNTPAAEVLTKPAEVKDGTVTLDPAIVVAYVALPNVVAADIPWKIGEETEVEAVRVVNAPEPAVVAPIVVKFPATGVVIPIVELLIVAPVIVPPVIAEEDEAKLLAVRSPVTVVAPFRLTAPVPVENVPVPLWMKFELF